MLPWSCRARARAQAEGSTPGAHQHTWGPSLFCPSPSVRFREPTWPVCQDGLHARPSARMATFGTTTDSDDPSFPVSSSALTPASWDHLLNSRSAPRPLPWPQLSGEPNQGRWARKTFHFRRGNLSSKTYQSQVWGCPDSLPPGPSTDVKRGAGKSEIYFVRWASLFQHNFLDS